MELTLKQPLDRQLCTAASLHMFLYYVQNGKLRLAQVTDKKQMFEAEWCAKGNTDNEGIALSRPWSQGTSLFGWRNTHVCSLFWSRAMEETNPDSACDSALQQQNFLNHWLLIPMSWLGGSKGPALHSATTRLQVMPCAVAGSPQQHRTCLQSFSWLSHTI